MSSPVQVIVCLLSCVTALHRLIGMDSIRHQNRISFWSVPKVIRAQEFESGIRFPCNPIGGPRTNCISFVDKAVGQQTFRRQHFVDSILSTRISSTGILSTNHFVDSISSTTFCRQLFVEKHFVDKIFCRQIFCRHDT